MISKILKKKIHIAWFAKFAKKWSKMKIVKSYPECYLKKKVVQTNNLQKIIHNGNFQKKIDQEDKCGTLFT